MVSIRVGDVVHATTVLSVVSVEVVGREESHHLAGWVGGGDQSTNGPDRCCRWVQWVWV